MVGFYCMWQHKILVNFHICKSGTNTRDHSVVVVWNWDSPNDYIWCCIYFCCDVGQRFRVEISSLHYPRSQTTGEKNVYLSSKSFVSFQGVVCWNFFLSIDRLFSLSWESQSALVHSYDILWRRWRAVDKMSVTPRSWRLPCGRERGRSQRWEPLRNKRSVDLILQLLFAVHDNKLFVLYVGFYTQLGQLKKLQIERDGAVRALRHHLVSSDTSELPEEGKQDLLARC